MGEVAQNITLENLGVLDLRGKTGASLAGVGLIQNVGLIIVPDSLADALMGVPQRNVGSTLQLPDSSENRKVKLFTGQISLGGNAFANEGGSSEDILVIAGQGIVTSQVDKVGYGEVIVMGQLIAPKNSESVLAAGLTRMMGQVIYYTADVPRFYIGSERFSRAFLELIDTPMSMALIGDFEFESDIDIPLMKAKVSELILIGEIKASRKLIPLLQLLAVTKFGEISASDDAEDADAQGA